MPGVLPASPNAEVGPRYNLWLSRLPRNQRGAARNQQAVEREPELSLPKTPARSSSLRRVMNQRAKIKQATLWPPIVGRWKARVLLRVRYGCETPLPTRTL